MTLAVLAVFIPTFVFVSATPGMCMTLSLTLGMTIGVRKALWMMFGELVGVGGQVLLVLAGGAGVMLNFPELFSLFKAVGGAYLFWVGIQLWQSKGRMAVQDLGQEVVVVRRKELAMQGFMTAIANPKGWAFFISLLPPFIDPDLPLPAQMFVLTSLILFIEFCFLMIYASGGRTLKHMLRQEHHVRLLNRIAGSLMCAIGIWLALF